MLTPPNHFTNVAQALMTFALDTTNAAQELLARGAAGGELSQKAQRVIAAWQGMSNEPVRYEHPTADAIADDEETADFALVCAVRALKDALNATQLGQMDRQLAAAMFMIETGSLADVDYALMKARSLEVFAPKVPFDKAMRTISKALSMATLMSHAERVMPPEMVDYVQRAALLVEEDRILPPEAPESTVTGHENPPAGIHHVISEPVHLNWNGAALAPPPEVQA